MKPARQPGKSSSVRQANEMRLLELMHERGVVTQADLASLTGLQASTIFRIFRSLEERGEIVQVDPDLPPEPKQGRKPGYYALNSKAAYSLGVDLAHQGTAVLLVDFTGQAVLEKESRFKPDVHAEDVLADIILAIKEVLEQESVPPDKLLGIGLGAPGVIDIAKGTVVKYSRLPGMEGLPLRQKISDALGVPVIVHNNASVIALAENRFGRAVGHESVVAFLIRSGVGGAFVKGGEIYTSRSMTAFELGHTTLTIQGHPNPRRVTLEDVMSEDGLVNEARLTDKSIVDLDSLVACMESTRDNACPALEDVADAFIAAARNLALVLNPDAFVIVARHRVIAEYFAKQLDDALGESNIADRFSFGTVIPLEYDPILACRGAADLVFDRYFSGTL